jgi:hypothetical protein
MLLRMQQSLSLELYFNFDNCSLRCSNRPLYTAQATSIGGRGGHVRGTEGFEAKLAYPKALGGWYPAMMKLWTSRTMGLRMRLGKI